MTNLIIIAVLLLLGLYFGSLAEKRHYSSIRRREGALVKFPTVAYGKKQTFSDFQGALVSGSVVIGSDYFKSFASAIKGIFGGRLGAFESLLDRARREAILRMREQATKMGADMVVNMRVETSTISNVDGKNKGLPSVEVHAYGTALVRKPNGQS